MEKDVQLGQAGAVKLSLEKGKAVIEIGVAAPAVLGGAVTAQASASASVDSLVLLDMLFAAIEAKSPAGAAAIEEGVKLILKQAVSSIA